MVHVLLPEGYDPRGDKKYPVLYVHDGQNLFDAHVTHNRQEWQIDEVIKLLSESGQINPPICVAITNTDDRSIEYGDTSPDNKYAAFIVNELKPLIDSTFKTLPDRQHTSTMGASLGGTISFYLVWQYNHIFSKAACLSPAFKSYPFDMVTPVLEYRGAKKDLNLYIDNGTKGVDYKLQPGIDKMLDVLNQRGYTYKYIQADGAEHNENAWSQRIKDPLVQFFAK